MNQKINLCEILKGHEGETFYSTVYGYIILKEIVKTVEYPLCFLIDINGEVCHKRLTRFGQIHKTKGECILFPSKDQRDWDKWMEEQRSKIWDDIKECDVEILNAIRALESNGPINPIVKSALALLKIHQLIEAGYSGNVTDEEWTQVHVYYYTINYNKYKRKFDIYEAQNNICHVTFHTKNQAEEFLSRPENVELLKDYFMV